MQSQVIASMIEHGVSGFLISPTYVDEAEGLEPVRRAGIPAMQVLRRIDARTETFPFASLDYETGGRLAAEHLLGLGPRRIAFVGGLENRPVTEERMAGYLAVMAEAGLPTRSPSTAALRAPSAATWPSPSAPSTPRSRRRSASPTSSRSGCSRASPRPASRVGTDFRLVGFDDIEECALTWPQLSSVRCDVARFGRGIRRGDARLARGRRRPPETRLAPVELIPRHPASDSNTAVADPRRFLRSLFDAAAMRCAPAHLAAAGRAGRATAVQPPPIITARNPAQVWPACWDSP